ncbi:MAG: peroxiredoxin [Rhodanobacter sp.]
MRSDNLYLPPNDLPVPADDGACDHLCGSFLPSFSLPSTSGEKVDLSEKESRWTVVYCYPRTGRPDQEPVGGIDAWNAIPGARGCTPQSCAYRDHYAEIRALGATVYGLSTQDTAYQMEAVDRLHLPFSLLSDADLAFAEALRLPTFTFAGLTLIERLTLIIHAGKVEAVFYPVFPSDADAAHVVAWLTSHRDERAVAQPMSER